MAVEAVEAVAVVITVFVIVVAVAVAAAIVVVDGNVKLLVLFSCCVVVDVTTIVACTRSISGLVMASNQNDNRKSREKVK